MLESSEEEEVVNVRLRTPTIRLQKRNSNPPRSYLTETVYKVVLRKSIPAQIRQFILYISHDKGLVDEFVRELTVAKQLSVR